MAYNKFFLKLSLRTQIQQGTKFGTSRIGDETHSRESTAANSRRSKKGLSIASIRQSVTQGKLLYKIKKKYTKESHINFFY